MVSLIAFATYGVLRAFIQEEKIMWGAIFAMLFAIRKIIKDNLRVGYSRYSVEIDDLTDKERLLHQIQAGLSFAFYVSGFVIIFSKMFYDPAIIFLIIIAILTIIFDIYIYFKKRNSLLFNNNVR